VDKNVWAHGEAGAGAGAQSHNLSDMARNIVHGLWKLLDHHSRARSETQNTTQSTVITSPYINPGTPSDEIVQGISSIDPSDAR
ncbi:hypothetical protein BGX34_005660, partial [Mortierella sp. NVP85]